jgi:hypothetical protein
MQNISKTYSKRNWKKKQPIVIKPRKDAPKRILRNDLPALTDGEELPDEQVPKKRGKELSSSDICKNCGEKHEYRLSTIQPYCDNFEPLPKQKELSDDQIVDILKKEKLYGKGMGWEYQCLVASALRSKDAEIADLQKRWEKYGTEKLEMCKKCNMWVESPKLVKEIASLEKELAKLKEENNCLYTHKAVIGIKEQASLEATREVLTSLQIALFPDLGSEEAFSVVLTRTAFEKLKQKHLGSHADKTKKEGNND